MARFYKNLKTNSTHIVDDFPSPRSKDAVACGQKIDQLKRITATEYYGTVYAQCLKCRQLTGR